MVCYTITVKEMQKTQLTEVKSFELLYVTTTLYP